MSESMHDEAFKAAFDRLRFTRATAASARVLFDAGVAAERERCLKIVDKWATAWNNPAEIIDLAIRNGETP